MQSTLERAISKAKEGISLANAGDSTGGLAAASEALALYPQDVNVQHFSGVIFSTCREFDKALEHFRRALEIFPNFHFTEVEIALVHRARGDFDEARRWLDKAIESAPTYVPAFIFAAQLERQRGSSFAALELLERARKIAPINAAIINEIVDVLIWHSERERAEQILEETIHKCNFGASTKILYIGLLAELGLYAKLIRFCEEFEEPIDSALADYAKMQSGHARLAISCDKRKILRLARRRERSSNWQSVHLIKETLRAVVSARRPFSLIRLGDGESRILIYLDSASRMVISDLEASAIGDSIWRNWFGASLGSQRDIDLHLLKSSISEAIDLADIIGVSTAQRLLIDNFHFGYLAYLETYLSKRMAMRAKLLTDATVNTALHKLTPFYKELLEGLDFVGFIGPHPDLASRLADYLAIPHYVSYVVPGEMRLPERSGLVRGVGHFPQRFNELMKGITVPCNGSVFLVAAGILGKIYCAQIKKLGGIAIDIGAIADAWTGINSRPGLYDRTEEWSL